MNAYAFLIDYRSPVWAVAALTGFRVSRVLQKYLLSDREIEYQFLHRIPIQNRTIAYDIVNHDSNEKQVFIAGNNSVIDVTTPALNTSQREMPMLGIERRSAR